MIMLPTVVVVIVSAVIIISLLVYIRVKMQPPTVETWEERDARLGMPRGFSKLEDLTTNKPKIIGKL